MANWSERLLINRKINGSTVGEYGVWKTGCIEEDTKEDRVRGNDRRKCIHMYTEIWRERHKSSALEKAQETK